MSFWMFEPAAHTATLDHVPTHSHHHPTRYASDDDGYGPAQPSVDTDDGDSGSAGGADTNAVFAAATDYDTLVNPTAPDGITEGTGWAILHGTSGQDPIQVRNMETYYLSSSNQWVEAQSSDTGSIGGTYLDQGDAMPINDNGDGTYTVHASSQDVGPGTGSGHFWLSPHGTFPSDAKGVFVTVDAQGSSNYTIEMGFDWWPDVQGKFDPAAEGYQGGSSNPQQLGSAWESYAFSSVPLDVLQSNPPPGF